MHHTLETPPPPAPESRSESFQTTSTRSLLLVKSKLVPPTAMTYGSLAGVTVLTRALAVELFEQPVEPESPEAEKIVWSWAFACSNKTSWAFWLATGCLASQLPQETDMTLSVSEVTHFLKMP